MSVDHRLDPVMRFRPAVPGLAGPGREPDPVVEHPAERRPAVIGMPGRAAVHVALHVVGTGLTGWLVGVGVRSVAPDRNAQWILGRASGIACLVLLTVLALSGILLAHPWRARRVRPNATIRIRTHVSLAVFTLALFVVHLVVLATDPWAKVGWWGALLPMASDYRPASVTLGVVAGYSGLVSGLTAAFAGRWAGRLWSPLHRASALALMLAWLHGLLAGSDTPTLLPLYLGSGALVLTVGMSRYVAVTTADRVRELVESSRADEEDLA